MKRALVFFVVGLVVGELDPVGWAAWQVLERQLPGIQQQSLAAPSPFEEMPRSAWLAESEHAFIVEDRHAPTAPVHLLVIPKRRYTSLLEPPAEVLGEMLDLARSAALRKNVADSGFRIIINTNPHGAQTVYHLHMHVKGGQQLHEPLMPVLWGRFTQRWRAG